MKLIDTCSHAVFPLAVELPGRCGILTRIAPRLALLFRPRLDFRSGCEADLCFCLSLVGAPFSSIRFLLRPIARSLFAFRDAPQDNPSLFWAPASIEWDGCPFGFRR